MAHGPLHPSITLATCIPKFFFFVPSQVVRPLCSKFPTLTFSRINIPSSLSAAVGPFRSSPKAWYKHAVRVTRANSGYRALFPDAV